MKNIFTLFVVAFLFSIVFASCKKETVTNTVYVKDTSIITTIIKRDTTNTKDSIGIHDTAYGSIAGFWPGTFGPAGTYPSLQFSYLFRTNGTVRVYAEGTDTASAPYTGEGTYTLTGYSVLAQFLLAGQIYSSAGTTDSEFQFYEGTIGQGLSTSGFAVNIAHKQ